MLNPAPENYLGKISSVTFFSWGEHGYIILHAVSCLVERQEGWSWDCLQCGCCSSSIEKTILGRILGKVLGDSRRSGSGANSSYCFLYSAPLPPSRASLGRHRPSAWDWACVSTHEPLWFQPLQAVQGRMPLQSRHRCLGWLSAFCWLTCLYKIFLLIGVHYSLLFQGDGVKAICINLRAVELS